MPNDDSPQEFIRYRLDELKVMVQSGFARVDSRYDEYNKRLIEIELWRARTDPSIETFRKFVEATMAAEKNQAEELGNGNSHSLVKIALAAFSVLSLLVGLALAIVQGLKP